MDETYTHNEYVIPARMLVVLRDYIATGRPVGHFLNAVLSNDLRLAIAHADQENLANLPAFTAYLYWEAPSQCHGSPERVKAWIAQGGLNE